MEDNEDCEKRERVLLHPWLENLIEGGSIPGLEWMDDGKTMFKVPWKHRSKKTWSLRHSSIFLEWAKNTGRWSEGDPEPNYAQLKTRLRCAFNKAPDIEEMRELHRTKAEEPYKVYKFIPRKESKLYPFGRRPLRKTTVPITVRRRRYFISRSASTYVRVSNRRAGAVSSDCSSIRIKEEKNEVSDSSYNEMTTEENFNDTSIKQNWINWLPDQNHQTLDGGPRGAWPGVNENEFKDQIKQILPLIVEEANINSMDVELPVTNHKVVESSRASSFILPEIMKDQIDRALGSVDAPLIGAPRLLEDDQIDKEGSKHKEIFSCSSLTSEKLEYLHCWQRDSSAIYANRRFATHPSSDPVIPNGLRSILPHVSGKNSHSDSAALDSGSRAAAAYWPRPAPDVRSDMASHPLDHFVREKRPSHSTEDPETAGHAKPVLVPAARLLPRKKMYIASQTAFEMERSSAANEHSIVQEKRVDAVVKPSVNAQPRVAVASPYGGKATLESDHRFSTDSVLDSDLPELEVIDLSGKISADQMHNSESKVLDLTKKMVVTPFERDGCTWRNATKPGFPDLEKDSYENPLPSDSNGTMNELLRFKSDYKRKKQLMVTKTMLLLEKERELKAREKQLGAREEALFWKETYLQRVLSGFDYNGMMPPSSSSASSTGGSMAPFTPSGEGHCGPGGRLQSAELKEACLKNRASSALTLFTPQHSSTLMPGRLHQPLTAVPCARRAEHLNSAPGFQTSSRDAKDGFLSSAATSASFSANPCYLPIGAALPVAFKDSKMARKALLTPSSGDQTKYDGGSDLRFEPESDVALGDAYPVMRKSHPSALNKFQPEAGRDPVAAADDAPFQPLLVTRRRGRPKGSKNKAKLGKSVDDLSPLTRHMPPLLVIQSSAMNGSVDPNAQTSLPFHFVRHEDPSDVVIDDRDDVDSSAKSRRIDARDCRRYETDRILPPVTADTGFGASLLMSSGNSGRGALLAFEPAAASNPVMRSPRFDHYPNKDVMPETVRQLLVSASRPLSNILPPLSPPKSPDASSTPKATATFIHRRDERPSDDEKAITSVF